VRSRDGRWHPGAVIVEALSGRDTPPPTAALIAIGLTLWVIGGVLAALGRAKPHWFKRQDPVAGAAVAAVLGLLILAWGLIQALSR
jgi:hypothetical protein